MEYYALLAAVHHLLAFSLISILVGEFVILSSAATASDYKRLGKVDLFYGLFAGLLLAVGLLRVYYGESGPEFYLENPVFWLKLSLFILVGILSIPPTIRFTQWNRRVEKYEAMLPQAGEKAFVMKWIKAEAALLLAIPVLAAFMARGVGL